MIMFPWSRRPGLAGLIVFVLVANGCQLSPRVLPEAGPANATAAQLKLADQAIRLARHNKDPRESAGQSLFAAEIAWDLDWKTSGPLIHHDSRKAARVYDAAVLELMAHAKDPDWLLATGTTGFLVPGPRGMYRLTFDPAGFPTLRDYKEFKPSTDFRGNAGFDHRIIRDGIGVPVVAINRGSYLPGIMVPGKEDEFKRREGYTSPRTVVLTFGKPAAAGQPRDVRVSIVDPRKIAIEQVGKRALPVAADFTAPLIAAYPGFGSHFAALIDAIYPDALLPKSDIYALEVYDPERIPVLLVHGLFSTPDMWKNVINELNAAPGIGANYQFYTFTYPTGLAPSFTARILRDKLSKANPVRPLDRDYVLIGHSMGGILSRLQMVDSGRVLWNENFGDKADEAYRHSSPADPLRRELCFSADRRAKRAIFICVPHQGSPWADTSIVQWLGKLVRTPFELTEMLATSPLRVIGVLPDRLPTSAQGLSPESPVLKGLAKLPVAAPVHSIIGNRGKNGPLPGSSDGIVPYSSSHLDWAASEKIIPTGHGGYDDPEAVAEIKRILDSHLRSGSKGPAKSRAR